MNIGKYVDEAMRYCGGSNPRDAACDLGYFIHDVDLGEEVLGFHLIKGSAKIIALNTNLSKNKRDFVLAHELGHAMMHKGYKLNKFTRNSFYSTNKMEKEANIFAALLLFRHRESICTKELSEDYDIEEDVLKDLLGTRLGEKAFYTYI